MIVSLIPTYNCNWRCDYCYLGKLRSDETVISPDKITKAFKEIFTYKKDITKIDIFGGEISLIDKSKMQDIIQTCVDLCPETPIDIISNLSNTNYIKSLYEFCKIRDYDIQINTSIGPMRPYYKQTLINMSKLKDCELGVLIVVLPELVRMSDDQILNMFDELNKNNVKNISLIQYYDATLSNSHYNVSNKEFVNTVSRCCKLIKNNNFNFYITNDDQVKTNAILDSAFISPYGEFMDTDYDSNMKESFVKFNSFESLLKYQVEKLTLKSDCLMCPYYNKCLTEHFRTKNDCIINYYER